MLEKAVIRSFQRGLSGGMSDREPFWSFLGWTEVGLSEFVILGCGVFE